MHTIVICFAEKSFWKCFVAVIEVRGRLLLTATNRQTDYEPVPCWSVEVRRHRANSFLLHWMSTSFALKVLSKVRFLIPMLSPLLEGNRKGFFWIEASHLVVDSRAHFKDPGNALADVMTRLTWCHVPRNNNGTTLLNDLISWYASLMPQVAGRAGLTPSVSKQAKSLVVIAWRPRAKAAFVRFLPQLR